jgi:uncharacterized protein (DUF1810 family)
MTPQKSLQRFIEAQEPTFERALAEIRNGSKQSHWMWFIFPQIQGLGISETSKYYAITNISEAIAYIKHPLLGNRLVSVCNELLKLKSNDAHNIFGSPDDLKLKSSMTLFASLPGADPVFQLVLQKFFNGEKDPKTLHLLNR